MLATSIVAPMSRMLAWAGRWPGRMLSSAFRPPGRADSPRRHGAQTEDEGECRAAMRSVLETQIIPRLVQAQRADAVHAAPSAVPRPQPADIDDFAACCARGDRAAGTALIERLRADGLPPDSVLVDLIAPAARRLGERWEDDSLDFLSVTNGLVLMHQVIHAMGYEYHEGPQASGAVRRVMLASAPGSQHVLGLSIVSEFFRKAGWQVVLEVSPSRAELCHAVANEWFDVIGLSVALDAQLGELPTLVRSLRDASRNPQPPVLLGGPVFLLQDLRAERFGAQAICLDARDSVAIAQRILPA